MDKSMNRIKIELMRATAAAAQNGEWKVGKTGGCVASDMPIDGAILGADDTAYYGGHLIGESMHQRNAAHIASASPHRVLALIQEIDREFVRGQRFGLSQAAVIAADQRNSRQGVIEKIADQISEAKGWNPESFDEPTAEESEERIKEVGGPAAMMEQPLQDLPKAMKEKMLAYAQEKITQEPKPRTEEEKAEADRKILCADCGHVSAAHLDHGGPCQVWGGTSAQCLCRCFVGSIPRDPLHTGAGEEEESRPSFTELGADLDAELEKLGGGPDRELTSEEAEAVFGALADLLGEAAREMDRQQKVKALASLKIAIRKSRDEQSSPDHIAG